MLNNDENVLTHFKRLDDGDDYLRKNKYTDSNRSNVNRSNSNSKINTSSVFKKIWNPSTSLESNKNIEPHGFNNAPGSFVTVLQPDTRKSSTNEFNKLKISNTSENNKMINEDMDTNIEVNNVDEKSSSASKQYPSDPASNTSTNTSGEKYNISNLLKHIYVLKYMQRQTVSSNQTTAALPVNEPATSSFQMGNSKQFWMPDDQVKECFECNDKFTMFNRRHHCRVCGQIFCSKCSDYEIPSQLIWPNSTGNIRACTLCHSFVGQMETGDIKHNTQSIKALMQRLSITSSNYSPFSTNSNQVSTDTSTMAKDKVTPVNEKTSLTSSQHSTASTPGIGSSSNSSINKMMSNPEITADTTNNPFDVAENKDLDKAHDTLESSQLNIINSSSELRNLWVQIYHTSDGVTFQTRNINKFKKINNCITGSELVEWLMRTKSVSKDQAIVIGQALVHGKWLECAYRGNVSSSANPIAISYNHRIDHNQSIFYDNNSYYKPGSAALNCNNDKLDEKSKVAHDTEEGPDWIKELNKLIREDETDSTNMASNMNELVENLAKEETKDEVLKKNQTIQDSNETISAVPLIKIEPASKFSVNSQVIETPVLPLIHFSTPVSENSSGDSSPVKKNLPINSTPVAAHVSTDESALPHTPIAKPTKHYSEVSESLQQIHKKFQVDLLKQLLKLKSISSEWFDIIMPLIWKCVDLVKPDVKHDNDFMDIRKYIKIKKLPGFDKTNSKIINGLVFTKNVAHKKMRNEMKNPKILLLRSSIEYQRSEEKMCSLEPIFTAESQYLKNYCSKLLIRQNPEILIVEKSVARIAQEIFLQSNVSLVLNVKASLMDKLCRFLQADPMYSIDDVLRKPKLGFCSNFHVESVRLANGRVKPLMFFEGTPTNLGCTILLYGSTMNELNTIKSICKFMMYAVYNSKLEQSFVFDKYADFSIKIAQIELKSDLPLIDSESENLRSFEDMKNNMDRRESAQIDNPNKITNSKQKKEIAIEQSPLIEATKFFDDSVNIQPMSDSLVNKSDNSTIRVDEAKDLKLEICEEYSDKNFMKLSRNFKQLIDDIILSCSPFIKFELPVLLHENEDDLLREFLPDAYMNYLKSSILFQEASSKPLSIPDLDSLKLSNNKKEDLHDFLLMHLSKSFNDDQFKRSYADFKSRGGIASMNTTKRLILKHIEKVSNSDVSMNQSSQVVHQQAHQKPEKKSKIPKNFDCLDIFNRQHMAVLFYSQCESSPVFPNICNKPRIIDMKFYCENDMTVGSFLARNCFRMGYKCNNELCDTLIVFHTRTFAHGESKITIRMSIVPSASPSIIAPQSSSSSPQANLTPVLSKSSSNSSFPKVSGDEKQVFSNLNVNALMNPNANTSTNIVKNKSYSSSESLSNSNTPIESLVSKHSMTPDSSSTITHSESPNMDKSENLTNSPDLDHDDQKKVVYDDINIFMWSVCKLCNKSTKKTIMSPDTWSFSMAKFLELTFHANNYHQFSSNDGPSCCKHSLFQDHYQYFRFRNVVTVFSTSKINLRSVFLPPAILTSTSAPRSRIEYIDEIKDLFEKGLLFYSTLLERISNMKSLNLLEKQVNKLDQYMTQINSDTTLKQKIEKINLLLTNQSINVDKLMNSSLENFKILTSSDLSKNTSEPVNYELIEMHLIELRKFIATSTSNWNTKMSEFFKKTKYNEEDASNDPSRLGQLAKKEDDELYGKQISMVSDNSDSNNDLSSGVLQAQTESATANLKSNENSFTSYSPIVSQTSYSDDDHKTSSAITFGKRFIANLIPSSAFQPLKIPFPEEEHYLLSAESKYYVDDKNLSSIVAFTLSSKEYMEFQTSSAKLSNKENMKDISTYSSQQSIQNSNLDECDTPNISNDNVFHFEHQFYDSTTKFYCKVYYADLFTKLRQLIMPNEEEKYIHSLFRCMNWDAKGGKSNSQFRKTKDNRFVLKEMSKQEVQSFIEFAPQYVQYITDSIRNKKATALAKIFGAYRICLMKNTSIASKAVKMDVIVMENLFYNRTFTQVFDLKGSERNRMINVNQQPNKQSEKDIVLLDENFLRWSFDNPIYVKPHTKHVLIKAIENDSKFLSSRFVMDYSLLCGFDQVNNMIVVGIIDYLRVFTWDKKVETYLKTISGQGKMPTIVSPEVYKTRFVNAIDRYFLEVPDQWYQKQ